MIHKLLNGTYPFNPLWNFLPALIIIVFEVLVTTIELSIALSIINSKNTELSKESKIMVAIVVGNTVTFIIGVILQYMLVGVI